MSAQEIDSCIIEMNRNKMNLFEKIRDSFVRRFEYLLIPFKLKK
jgi:hypothetical protein